MPQQSKREGILNSLEVAKHDLQIARYADLLGACIQLLRSNSETDSEPETDLSDSSMFTTSTSDLLDESDADLLSLLMSSDNPNPDLVTFGDEVWEYELRIEALEDEVRQARYLVDHKKTAHRAPQLQLLEQWALDGDNEKFHRKLRVDPVVFTHIVNRIQDHPGFTSKSNNPQFPIPIQLAIFLNGAGHYGNAATTQDLAEWAGVSVGTVYNCIRRVMAAILPLHDQYIHFDPLEEDDQREQERAKQWVEKQCGIPEWRHGWLCVDGTPINLFQKPGWHGEGFYDRKSRYSLSSQVIVLPHNLRIVDYVIGVPGSLHDSNSFAHSRLARHPNSFLGAGEWVWADSTYPCQPWCVPPFKRPTAGALSPERQAFNQQLSSIRVRSEHFFGSLKGWFQYLREMRIQVQQMKDLTYTNIWIHCCLILHNMIVEIEEELGIKPSLERYQQEAEEWGDVDDLEDIAQDEEFTGTPGQLFCKRLMDILSRRCET